MKKIITLILAALMLLVQIPGAPAAFAADSSGSSRLVVGSVNPVTGSFFMDNVFGNITADMDVREMLHGYALARWDNNIGNYKVDNTAVDNIVVYEGPEGNRTYEIELNRDLRYSDGTKITAWDYAFSILLSMSPELEAIGGDIDKSDKILGAKEYRTGESDKLAGVQVVNDYLFSITIRAEFLPYFYELAMISYKPYPIHVIAPSCSVGSTKNGAYIENAGLFTAELLESTLLDPDFGYVSRPSVVSGPYRMVSYDAEAGKVEFAINEYYKGNSDNMKPSIENVTLLVVTNEEGVEMLRSGEMGLFNKTMKASTTSAGMEAVGEGKLRYKDYFRNGFSFVSYCCERPAIAEQKVRQAIALCFDRDGFLLDYIGEENGQRVDGYYGVGQWMYSMLVSDPLKATETTVTITETEDGEIRTETETETIPLGDEEEEQLGLNNVTSYTLDVETANKILDEAGWTLNEQGTAYDPTVDSVRCKKIAGHLVSLNLSLVCPEETGVAPAFETYMVPHLREAGINLTVVPTKSTELMKLYYEQEPRDCDMIYLASNFQHNFDPSMTFLPGGPNNYTNIDSQELYDKAVAMRETASGATDEYVRKWIQFQQVYMDILPAIPVYSNSYYDFYTTSLKNYDIALNPSWALAIVGARLG